MKKLIALTAIGILGVFGAIAIILYVNPSKNVEAGTLEPDGKVMYTLSSSSKVINSTEVGPWTDGDQTFEKGTTMTISAKTFDIYDYYQFAYITINGDKYLEDGEEQTFRLNVNVHIVVYYYTAVKLSYEYREVDSNVTFDVYTDIEQVRFGTKLYFYLYSYDGIIENDYIGFAEQRYHTFKYFEVLVDGAKTGIKYYQKDLAKFQASNGRYNYYLALEMNANITLVVYYEQK